VLEANQQGGDIIVFGTQYQNSPGGLMSLPKNPVRSIHDVLGKRIGLDPSSQIVLNACLDVAGLAHRYTAVNVSGDPEALVLGRVDAMAVFITSQPVTLTIQGIPNIAVSFTQLGFPSYQNVLAARRETYSSDPDLLVRYLRGLIRGWEVNNANPTAGGTYTYQTYGKLSALNLRQQILEDQAQVPLMESSLTASKGLFQMSLDDISGPQYKALEKSGVKNLPSVSSFVVLDILEKVYAGAKSLPV
jgi:ABC-type nitrate/sulfonate/bicarbonate transport system substrate-binding protein